LFVSSQIMICNFFSSLLSCVKTFGAIYSWIFWSLPWQHGMQCAFQL
jgi:hypothetical protein